MSVLAKAIFTIMKWAVISLTIQYVAGCSSHPTESPDISQDKARSSSPGLVGRVIAQSSRFVVYVPSAQDTLRSLAEHYLGTVENEWMISEFNDIQTIEAGMPLIIPLRPLNPLGVDTKGFQTVPILTYHRFGTNSDKMVVTSTAFAEQLQYLKSHDYHVIRLSDLVEFLNGKRALPKRSVVITMDDGYLSNYQYAFPLLKKYGFPATIFLYTDFAGAADSMNWAQMKEMIDSKLIDIQAHSKTHANLSERLAGESESDYRKRIENEVITPRNLLLRKLASKPVTFAYPYGDSNPVAIDIITKAGFQLAVTVNPGGNPFFAHPYLLRRSMILGDHSIEDFKSKLQVYVDLDL